MKRTYIYIIISLILFQLPNLTAQESNKLIRKGNKAYKNNDFSSSEKQYRKALLKDPENKITGTYNLGNALYKQDRFKESIKMYDTLVNHNKLDKKVQSKLYHNKGNALLNEALKNKQLSTEQKQDYLKQAIDSYKQSLRINSKDEDTKYNLSFAKKLIKKMQQQNKNQNKKDNQNNNNSQQNKQNQKKDQKKDNKQKSAQPKISKDDIERMLNAVENQEKQTLKKIDKTDKSSKIKIEKDW